MAALFARSSLAITGLLVLAAAAACRPALPPSKPLAELSSQETSGYQVYRAACAGCHYPNSEGTLRGPGLHGLYKKQYLPSGAPANDDRVRATILGGRNMMPPFQAKLEEQQVQDLLAYLHTL
ncbi:MAG TPA: cytochrome c [Acidisarcina sp.]